MRLHRVIVILLTALLCWVSCERDLSTETKQTKPLCEKDSEITYYCYEYCNFDSSNGQFDRSLIDSLIINEFEHQSIIDNAIPFSAQPGEYINFEFYGEFNNMPDNLFIWYRKRLVKLDRTVDVRSIESICPNQGIGIFSKIGTTLEPISGYIFMMDDDDIHSGNGFVFVKTETNTDTLYIDANKNTIQMMDNWKTKIINTGPDCIGLELYSSDFESYLYTDDQVILLLYDYDMENSDIQFIHVAATGGIIMQMETALDSIWVTGFVPIFETLENGEIL